MSVKEEVYKVLQQGTGEIRKNEGMPDVIDVNLPGASNIHLDLLKGDTSSYVLVYSSGKNLTYNFLIKWDKLDNRAIRTTLRSMAVILREHYGALEKAADAFEEDE